MIENESAPFELYLSFNRLPAWQLAYIMGSVSNIYAVFRDPDIPVRNFDFDVFYREPLYRDRAEDDLDSELCLDYARTGNSITFRFNGHGRWPAITSNTTGDLDVAFPASWGGPTVAVAVLLAGVSHSQDIWKGYLDAEHKKAQTRVEAAQEEKARAEAKYWDARVEEIRQNMRIADEARRNGISATRQTPRAVRKARVIQNNIKIFNKAINNVNIDRVEINGVVIKGSPNNRETAADNDAPD